MIAFYNGVSGMVAYQEAMNVTAHNISNVNTTGFKPSRSSFNDLLYTRMNTKVEGENLTGHGVKHQGPDLIMRQGSVDPTGSMLDFAIDGDGFFAVDNDGTTEYTRNGAFAISAEGKTLYLVTTDGRYVLDKTGKNIKIPKKTVESSTKDANGNVSKTTKTSEQPDLEALASKIGIYRFDNPYGLTQKEGSRFLESDLSGKAVAEKEPEGYVKQGMLETSGVDLANEMVKMIESQRAFQLNAKVVQTADELDNTVNNLR